jgi:dienelactone hydrolase
MMRRWLRAPAFAGYHPFLLAGLLLGILTGCAPVAHGSAAPTPSATASPTPRPTATPTASRPIPPTGSFVPETYVSPDGLRMTYYLYLPRSYNPQHSYPLVLLLHGGGEVGSASNSPAQNAQLLLSQPYVRIWTSSTVQDRWPSIIVVPQLIAPNHWVNVPVNIGSYTLARDPSTSLLAAENIVIWLRQRYATINPRRIYLTGLSLGGYGAWEMAERWPTTFAAVAPLAGGGDPSQARSLVNLPIWAFQGADDTIVPISGSRNMIQAIQADGGHPHYTQLPGDGHDIWVSVVSRLALRPAACPHPVGMRQKRDLPESRKERGFFYLAVILLFYSISCARQIRDWHTLSPSIHPHLASRSGSSSPRLQKFAFG